MNGPAPEPRLLVHGGAGVIRRDMEAPRRRAVREGLCAALRAGYATLGDGGSALDAAVAAVAVLEDDPLFNAGRGSVLTHEGTVEMDAAVMDGATRRAGAVAGVRQVRHPVHLARAVMRHSDHVMLVGEGAEAFARHAGLERIDPDYFVTEARSRQLVDAQHRSGSGQAQLDGASERHFGTVGAVALDVRGHLAAATSTGGMTDKRWGRVGDSAIIGAGTYADARCAVSCTGWGEYFMRTVAAHAICTRVTLLGESVERAADEVIRRAIPELGGSGGAIVLGADGHHAMPFTTAGMFRGWIGPDGTPHAAIWPDGEAAAD